MIWHFQWSLTENFILVLKQLSCLFTFPLELWDIDFQMKCKFLLSSEKRTLDHQATVQVFFSLAKMPLKSLLVQKWLDTRNGIFVAFCCVCGGSSFSPLLVKLPKIFELDLLGNLLQAAVIHLCLWTFFYHSFPFQSTFHQYTFILHHEQLSFFSNDHL